MQNYAEVLKDFVEKHSTGLTVAAVAGIGILGLRRWMAGGVCRSKARLDGKTVLITGANTGIGKVTAMDMAQRGARVIMACRDIPKAYSAADEIRQKTGNNNLLVKKLDLASLKSVRELSKYVQENEKRLDILINNAGIMMCPKWKTEDGFEMQIGVNHLGHFLLTNSLLDLLKKSAPSRVVVVASVAHVTGRIHFDDINLDRNYDNLVSYRQSKLANILFAKELAARLQGTGVTVYSLHPGLIRTELGRHLFPHWSWWKRMIASVLMVIVKSPWEGAQTSIYCAVEESLANESGLYYSDCARKKPAAPALDDAAAKKLWDLSASMGDLVAAGVLSGNRNFEGRVHPNTRANYLASPPLVIAYAIAGTVRIDFEKEPIAVNSEGRQIFLRDIWPTRDEIQAVERTFVIPSMFKEVYDKIEKVNDRWNSLVAPSDKLYTWDDKSTYIKSPPFFDGLTRKLPTPESIKDAYVLLNLGDSVTTDHISPAGNIARNSAAARYLTERGLTPREYNSYGSRRGNDAVMARGTFANIRLFNKFLDKQAPQTIHLPTGDTLDVFDAAERYKRSGVPLLVLAGKEYGSGSSRDWAAKGPFLLGIKAVLAESYERIHRSNLVGMGVIPLEYLPGDTAASLGLSGQERYSIIIPQQLTPRMTVDVELDTGMTFKVRMRFDTDVELTYFHHGGILNYMIRKMSQY